MGRGSTLITGLRVVAQRQPAQWPGTATVGFTVVYTFAFGVLMYLTLRSTGFLVGAMILHGLTDPTTILAVGGIDELRTGSESNDLLDAAGLFTIPLIAIGFVLLIFIRGKAEPAPVYAAGKV